MTLMIHSRTDIETYVADAHADFVACDLDGALVRAIQAAEHPDYGTDWADWLDRNVSALRCDVANES